MRNSPEFKVDGGAFKGLTDGLQGASDQTTVRKLAGRCRERINNHINLTQIFLDQLNSGLFKLRRKRIAVQVRRIQTRILGLRE